MKRRELLRRLADAAGEAGLAWELVRQGSSHELWRCGGALVTVPRHTEINDLTALGICRALETEPGEGWWKT